MVECRDGLARITSKELAKTHSVKDGILQNACSTKTRMVAVLGRSAHLHIVRLTHSRRNGPKGTFPAYCIPKVMRLKTGEVLCEKSYVSLRPSPKISLRHDHDWTRGKVPLGFTVEQQPVGKIVRQSRGEVPHSTFSQLTQPIPKPICDRSGKT